jgi:hypothetical protein
VLSSEEVFGSEGFATDLPKFVSAEQEAWSYAELSNVIVHVV